MSVFPFDLDDDATIIRIDDNISEMGGDAINQLRDAMFAVQKELGIHPAGSVSSVAIRLDKSLTSDGDIRASALASIGLVTLPIDNAQVGANAGIEEYKLDLDYSTSDLNTLVQANITLLNSINSYLSEVGSNLGTHIAGGSVLIDGSPGRHVASHIDLNNAPFDVRDATYIWTGLLDKDGSPRSATQMASALLEVNNAFTSHENSVDSAHNASAVDIDVDNFLIIPQDIDDVQKFAEYVDNVEVLELGDHRATQHEDSIAPIARSRGVDVPDGYGRQNIVPSTFCQTYLVRAPNTTPVDNISNGDNVISFVPGDGYSNGYLFDSQFEKVQNGDVIRVNYGNGMEAVFYVESTKFIPESTWSVRINGTNLADNDGYALARIDRPRADRNTSGVLAVAAANATPVGSFDTILSSVIVGNPRGATALGLDFDPGQLDAEHYNLYLEFYPSGNPADRVISLPAIDVTGDAGTTPGRYTLENVVQSTNDNLREIGYNFRLVAFAYDGEFGIMIADAIGNPSFSIIKGENSAGTLTAGLLTDNVIGEDRSDTFDALGLGASRAGLAGVEYMTTFIDGDDAAQLNTVVIPSVRSRNYIANGRRRDTFASTWAANEDGYWDGYISTRAEIGVFTVETTYTVFLNLKASGIKTGSTLVVQPVVAFTDPTYFDVDYGRFIVKSVNFIASCAGVPEQTLITVISGIHAAGTGIATSSGPTQPVHLYFSEDSVSFNSQNLIDIIPGVNPYRRHHEIFVTDEGKTFGHERGRMQVRAEDAVGEPPLATAGWHIETVSPKLRGYRDSATTYNKFIRFYILSYDTDTGEYDGYIGQRVPSTDGITSVGPVTTGRKNVPTKFYDETNIDFIELTFDELTSPGVSILGDGAAGGGGTPRYTDIELFSSLINQDEAFFLATCEVNWLPNPAGAIQIVQRVIDRRQVGSIGSEDFTDDAIDFITAGDRFLHENGILRGFEFDLINPLDKREVFYKGGFALVNGKVVPANATSVTIPEIHEDGDAPPPDKSIDWAVCVNEEGTLEPILVTATKQQFFAKDNNSANVYYLPSVTFTELVETRKDLTPISVLTATIGSFDLTDAAVLDVRRIIIDGGRPNLTLAPDGYVGQFNSFERLENWVNTYASEGAVKVKVRGVFNLASTVTLGFTSPVIFEGDGATINVMGDAHTGIILCNGVAFKNITFNYNPDTSGISFSSADDKINSANACLYSSGSISNVTVENCVFNSAIATQRPSFVGFEIDKEDVVQNINVVGNKFDDSGGATAEDQAAIAITSLNETGTEPAIVYTARIENNICNQRQGIYILQEADDQIAIASSISGPGIRVFDVIISGNNCGAIGYLTTAIETTDALPNGTDRVGGLAIKNNSCHLIATMANYTFATASEPGTIVVALSTQLVTPFPAGSADIHHNNCNAIVVGVTGHDDSSIVYSRISIESNRITATTPSILNIWRASFFGTTTQHWGMVIDDGVDDNGEVIVANNVFATGLVDSTDYYFTFVINSRAGANITGNIIRGIATNGYGIYATVGAYGFRQYIISNNQIYREERDVSKYIWLSSDETVVGGLVVDNYLDGYSTGTSDEVITGSGTSPSGTRAVTWIVERNKNQTEIIRIGGWSGTVGIRATASTYNVAGVSLAATSGIHVPWDYSSAIWFDHNDVGDTLTARWVVSLEEALPMGVEIISATCDISVASSPDTGGDAILYLRDYPGTPAEQSNTVDLTGVTGGTCTLPDGAWVNTWVNAAGKGTHIDMAVEIMDSAGVMDAFIKYIEMIYRW